MDKLIKRLDEVALGSLDKASFKASLRLQLYFTGRTHELMIQFGKQAAAALLNRADADGILDGTRGYRALTDLLDLWADTWKVWEKEFMAARRESVSIPYGVFAVRHDRLVAPLIDDRPSLVERLNAGNRRLNEGIDSGVFSPQIDVLLNAASEHLYGDGMNLSGRVWRIDRETREMINNVIMKGVADGDSAWNIAKQLEQFLGASENCPRWTSSRLYSRTATDRAAGDTTGLLSGDACDGQGVAYKALRLARTEIQKAHALATDKLMASQPWIEQEQCNLSASHPEPDECDDVAQGGENGDGVYPVGTIEYPLHPNCFCFKTAVLMDDKAFSSQLNGWLNGESWPAMDDYKETIGGEMGTDLMPEALSMAVWLFGEELGL